MYELLMDVLDGPVEWYILIGFSSFKIIFKFEIQIYLIWYQNRESWTTMQELDS
jgi:hypothetical protein